MLASRTRTVLRAGRRAGAVASALVLLAFGVSWSRSAEIPPDPAPRRTPALAVDHGPIVHSGEAQLDEALASYRLFSAVLSWNAATTTTTTTTLPPVTNPPAPRDPFTPSGECGGEVGALIHEFFWDDLAWAHHVALRESGCRPEAQNPSSTAAGVFQLLRMHAWRFDAVGCSWDRRYEARCNIAAARHLYNDGGRDPWRFSE